MAARTQADPVVRARRRSPWHAFLGLLVALVLVAGVLLPLIAATVVVTTARNDDRSPTDAIVVLGAAQFDGRPSPVLEARLEHAAELYADEVAPRIITVGGKQPGDISPRRRRARLARDAGVPRA